jgi:phosphatidylethanolamine-binding protein (PEBP) family uncharacterized protein
LKYFFLLYYQKYLAAYQNCTVQVFNGWGQKVFNSIGYGISWNGTYNGAAPPNGHVLLFDKFEK